MHQIRQVHYNEERNSSECGKKHPSEKVLQNPQSNFFVGTRNIINEIAQHSDNCSNQSSPCYTHSTEFQSKEDACNQIRQSLHKGTDRDEFLLPCSYENN